RALARLERQLDSQPLDTVRDGLIGSISRGRLLCEKADAILLAAPDLREESGLAKFSGWLHGRVRRDVELLLLLEERFRAKSTPTRRSADPGAERRPPPPALPAEARADDSPEAPPGE